jgi:aminoglycoside/choline kinase family phosphotransferase
LEKKINQALKWAEEITGQKFEATPLLPEGSGRRYLRLQFILEVSTVVLGVSPDPLENEKWLDFSEILKGKFPLPRIYESDKQQGFFLMEDMGSSRFDRLITRYNTRMLYAPVMKTLAKFHNEALELMADSPLRDINPAYTPEFVYEHEWKYFLGTLKILTVKIDHPEILETLIQRLLKKSWGEQVFIHRDFQSRNLMRHRGREYILDWQGARVGPAAYDLASLLYDPYVEIPPLDQKYLLGIYRQERADKNLAKHLDHVAPLRLMQAIGAYGHLMQKGLPYGSYISPALFRLYGLLAKMHGFGPLTDLVAVALKRILNLFPA